MRFTVMIVGLALVVGACGGKDSKASVHASPEAVVKAFLAAADKGDVAAAQALFPTDALIKEAMTCTKPRTIDKIKRERDKNVKRWLGHSELQGAEVAFKSMTDRRTKTFAKGAETDGCTLNMDFVVKKIKVKFSLKKGDKTKEEGEGFRVAKFGDKGWYLVDL